MNPGDSAIGEISLCETPKPRRFLGALLARIYETATYRATALLQAAYTGTVKQDPP